MTRTLLAALAAACLAFPARADSLFDARTYRSLAADNKAHRVGDALTIQVYENSSASSSTDTSTQRRNTLGGSLAISNPAKSREFQGQLNLGGDFAGGGSTQRANKLLAVLSVSVKEVLPNGDLRVAGEQLLTVNEEQHQVLIEGRVRPQDVSSDNVVLSTRLADARITYVGDGDLSERQRRGWWRVVLDWLGL